MLYAESETGEKILPVRYGRAYCPLCKGMVIGKDGDIMPAYWAHQSLKDCDNWYEPESDWHLSWKKMFPKHQIEVAITKNGKRHRADILGDEGTVIELQHSSISPAMICEREAFYGNLIWIFDINSSASFGRMGQMTNAEFAFKWSRPKRSLISCKKPLYLDFGQRKMLRITKLAYTGFGEGYYKDKAEFILEFGGTPTFFDEKPPRPIY